jgi:hypothetical protein
MNGFQDAIGKTIKRIERIGLKDFDDEPYVKFIFTDNTELVIEAGYGDYTGKSKDEYTIFCDVCTDDLAGKTKKLKVIK